MKLEKMVSELEEKRRDIIDKLELKDNYTEDDISDLYIKVSNNQNHDDSFYAGEQVGSLETIENIINQLATLEV